jgi:hypothetical protein
VMNGGDFDAAEGAALLDQLRKIRSIFRFA